MMSPLDTVVSEFSEKYGKKAQELINALMIYIHQGMDLTKAVNQALIDTGLNDFLTDNIEQAIAKSADIGAGINRKAGIPLLKPLESSWDGSGMKLSQKLHSLKKNIHLQVTDTIKAQLALNNNVSKISRELYDGYNTDKAVIERQSLPQYITKVISFARRSDLSDYERRQLLKLCRKTRAKVDKLSQNGAPNKALKTSYNKLLDAVESSKEHAIRKAVTTAVEEKSRYVAERIARTEAARAWQDGFLQKYDGNNRVIAYKWKLSGRHPIFDICDMYAKADMYGLGKGIFPKDKVPSIPVHPHCLCHLVPVYKTELKDKHQQENIKEAGEKWLKALPKQEQYKVLGIDGLKAWQNGADWRNYIRNYSTQVAQTRLKDLNIKPKNDIIKINTDWKNIKNWKLTAKGTIIPTKIIDKNEHYKTPIRGNPNDVIKYFTGAKFDINYDLYNSKGQLIGQINWCNHNNPKQHPFGKKGEHKHIIKWVNNKIQRGKAEKLSKSDYLLFENEKGEENDH